MFSIGEFSRITRLPIKTLRYYHERELLVPATIESGSGYRYYDESNVERARVIVMLRSLEFALDEIRQILSECEDDEQVIDYLVRRRSAVKQEINQKQDIAAKLDKLIQHEKQVRDYMSNSNESVVEKSLEPMLVAGIRMKGKYSDCGKGFAQLGKSAGRFISGKAMCLFYDEGYRENDADFEPCFPVKKSFDKSGIDVRELPGGRCLSLVHYGPYEELGRSYERLIAEAKKKDVKLLAPCREIYIKGPGMIFKGNPTKYVTEIQMMVDAGS